jgi:phage host-nuclease inhibitor protein Gam
MSTKKKNAVIINETNFGPSLHRVRELENIIEGHKLSLDMRVAVLKQQHAHDVMPLEAELKALLGSTTDYFAAHADDLVEPGTRHADVDGVRIGFREAPVSVDKQRGSTWEGIASEAHQDGYTHFLRIKAEVDKTKMISARRDCGADKKALEVFMDRYGLEFKQVDDIYIEDAPVA